MKLPSFSSIFYIANFCGLAFGAYLVLGYSLYRILLLYCLLNILFFWIIENRPANAGNVSLFRVLEGSKKTATGPAFVLVALLFILVVGNYGSIYARPSFIGPLLAVALVVMTIVAWAGIETRHKSFFTSNHFLLPMVISISLFANFSIYLVQPRPLANPLFATVDAYRDFANAARIVKLSGFRPQDMVLQQYYAELPVLPILVSILSISGGLPIQGAQIILAIAAEVLGVVVVWLLSTTVVRRIDPAFASPAGVLAVIFVWLQPYLDEPNFYLDPLRLSIPLLVLALYLLYQTLAASRRLSPSLIISILILVLVIVPMHASSAFAVIGFCVLAGLMAPTRRRLARTVVLIALVFFSVYLFSGAALPYTSLLGFATTTYSVLSHIMSHGPSTVSNQATILKVSELTNFMMALPFALALSICTVSIAKSWRLLTHNLRARKLDSLHLAFGVLAFVGLAGGYASNYFLLDMRYFAYPVTGLIVIACAIFLSFALRNASTSRIRGLILLGIIMAYAFSIAASPSALYETNPTGARLIPTESESVAGNFVAANIPTGKTYVTQMLSDWPFYDYMIGVTYSGNVGIEHRVRVVQLISARPIGNLETFVILRQYYLENVYLQQIGPYTGVLRNVDVWNGPNYNKVYDSSTTVVYLGTFEG